MSSISGLKLFLLVTILQFCWPVLSATPEQVYLVPYGTNQTYPSVPKTDTQLHKQREQFRRFYEKREKDRNKLLANREKLLNLVLQFGDDDYKEGILMWPCQSACESETLFNRCCEFFGLTGYPMRTDGTINTCEHGEAVFCHSPVGTFVQSNFKMEESKDED